MQSLLTKTDHKIHSNDLLSLINQARKDAGEKPIRQNDFNKRVKDELEGFHYETFVVQNANKTQSEVHALDHDQCMLVAMRESKLVRRKVLARLKALQPDNALPDFSDPAEAARAWADQFEKARQANEKLEVADHEIQRLQGVCHTIAAQFTPGMTPASFCRQLNGVNVQQVQNSLAKRGLLIKERHGFKAASYYRDNWFAEKVTEPQEGVIATKVVLTKKGAVNLYKFYLKGDLPMKANWDGSHTHCLFDEKPQ